MGYRMVEAEEDRVQCYPIEGKTCPVCNTGFRVRMNADGRKRKFCSVQCADRGRAKPRMKIDLEKATQLYVLRGWSCTQIAAVFNCCSEAVGEMLRRHGVKMRKRTFRRRCVEPGCKRETYRPYYCRLGFHAGARCRYHHKLHLAELGRKYYYEKRKSDTPS